MQNRTMLLAVLLALTALGQASAQTPTLDPFCLRNVPWEVDASGPLRVFGCRAAAKIAAPDSDGWTTYTRRPQNGSSAGFIRTKMDSISPGGVWTFEVQDNGGGSGTFPYKVVGQPDARGVLIPATVAVTSLPASNAGP